MSRQPAHMAVVPPAIALALWATAAGALLPPLTDYTFDDGERQVVVQTPVDWTVTRVPHGLKMQRDKAHDLFGTALLGFHEYDRAPTPDEFLETALAGWGEQFDGWRVLDKSAPPDRPRVRLASVGFRRFGFPCRGWVMAVIGRETGTLGFAWAESVAARQLHLDDLVQLLVAGSYGAFPVRSAEADDEALQAIKQASAKLYGGAKEDFKQLLGELEADGALVLEKLPLCGTYQPALRNLKGFLSTYLSARPQERVKSLDVWCLPTAEFNAFAVGPNEVGPGFLAFHTALTQAFDYLAQHYTSLRNRKLAPEALSEQLTSYSTALAKAVLAGGELPPPGKINFADDQDTARFEKVFTGMIGLVMAHELAHYYLRHADSGQTDDPFSIQQREVAADAAALAHLQAAADQSPNVWEGGAIHAFGLLATVDNVARQAGGAETPEWTRSHPLGTTRLSMATAALGQDDFRFRNDPWSGGNFLETGSSGVRVVGGLDPEPDRRTAFTHPQSQVEFTFPAGWVAQFDPDSNVLTMRPRGGGNLPVVIYSCGGDYPSPKAIASEVIGEMKKMATGLKETRNEAVDTGHDKLKMHLIIARGKFPAGQLGLAAVGIQSPGWSHGLMLMCEGDRLDATLQTFEELVTAMRYRG